MANIYVYNDRTKNGVLHQGEGDAMPYNIGGTLTVSESEQFARQYLMDIQEGNGA